MQITTLAILGFIALVVLIIWAARQASVKFTQELKEHCESRGWKFEQVNSLAGAWRVTGVTAGLAWQMFSGPDENDSDHDWHTVFTSELPFPESARLEVMFRMTWNATQSGLIRKLYDGPLSRLVPANSPHDPFRQTMSLVEVHGIGSPDFAEWFAVAGDSRTAHHLITPEVTRTLMQLEKMRRPTLSIHGSELKIKPTTHPLKIQEVKAILDIGQIVLRQAASGQKLSA
jgi:hypothetical protein